VVGLSADPRRDSHRVSAYMQERGYRIVPVNPNETAPILGERVYPALEAVPMGIQVDLVDVFRRSERTDAAIDAAIARGAAAVWLQEGVINDAGLARAQAAGLRAVQDRCLMVEHRRWAREQSGAS
jgi:predicted CoA-binding protein